MKAISIGALVGACLAFGADDLKRLSRDDWDDQVADMVERGAKGTPGELAAVVDYPTANFGPDVKVNVNDAPIDELKSVLGLSSPEANAIVEYRQGHGQVQSVARPAEGPRRRREEGRSKRGANVILGNGQAKACPTLVGHALACPLPACGAFLIS